MGMTDEELLMYQLRNPPVMSMALNKDHLYSMMHERMSLAAEKIEELGAKRDEVERRRVKWMNKSDELQTKLAKAVKALQYTDDGANHGAMTTTYSEHALRYILRNIRDRARVVLDEIKGET